ncbi:hypothetical protein B0H11DRAFT_2270688 [Mycena galericulata]|nr:hypothetical protein B0H11DRAFT_2270688 [Mycena galericulata]
MLTQVRPPPPCAINVSLTSVCSSRLYMYLTWYVDYLNSVIHGAHLNAQMLSRACTYSPLHYHPRIYYVLNIAQYIYFLLFRGHRMKFTRNDIEPQYLFHLFKWVRNRSEAVKSI